MRYKGEYSPSYLADPVRALVFLAPNLRSDPPRGNIRVVSPDRLHPTPGKIPIRVFFQPRPFYVRLRDMYDVCPIRYEKVLTPTNSR